MLDNEIYKDVIGYENYYSVSNLGNVYSKRSKKLLKACNVKDGRTFYKQVVLSVSGKHKTCRIHRLVAEAFIPKEENKTIVNHIDNDGTNNKVENLEWCTHQENIIHAQRQGRLFEAQSKGAKTQAKEKRNKMEQFSTSLVGKVFNKWTVLSYEGYLPVGSIQKPFIKCSCTCGNIVNLEVHRVTQGKTTQCVKCTGSNKNYTNYLKIINTYTNKIVNNWKITGKTNYQENLISRKLKLEAQCTNCGYIDNLPYKELARNMTKNCINCKHDNDIV